MQAYCIGKPPAANMSIPNSSASYGGAASPYFSWRAPEGVRHR